MSRFVTDVLNDDPLLTTSEVAAMYGVTAKTVKRWALAGQLPRAVKTLGGHWRFRRSEIEADLNA